MKRLYGVLKDARPQQAASPHLPPVLSRILACEDSLEEALRFLAQALADAPRRGKKPVVLHSLRVAHLLLATGYGLDVVIAGLLHDVLEKTELTPMQIGRRFGAEVAHMVQATTNDERIVDPLARYADSIRRCLAYGEGALLVRCADLIDNCDRLLALGSTARLERIAEKVRMLLRVCREELVDPRMVEELARRSRRVNRKVAGLALVSKKRVAVAKASRLSSRHK